MDTPSMAAVLRFSRYRERPALAAAPAGAAPGATAPAWRSWRWCTGGCGRLAWGGWLAWGRLLLHLLLQVLVASPTTQA